MRKHTPLFPALVLSFLVSCHSDNTPLEVQNIPLKQKMLSGDTLRKTADTIILKEKDRYDTLVKYKPLDFASYHVLPQQVSFHKRLAFPHYKFKKKFITTIKNGIKEQGMNFAGRYCFVYWDCGAHCRSSAVVDLRTGKVYNGLPSALGYRFKKDSRLLVVNPPDAANWYDITMPHALPEEYEWTGKEFKRITR